MAIEELDFGLKFDIYSRMFFASSFRYLLFKFEPLKLRTVLGMFKWWSLPSVKLIYASDIAYFYLMMRLLEKTGDPIIVPSFSEVGLS